MSIKTTGKFMNAKPKSKTSNQKPKKSALVSKTEIATQSKNNVKDKNETLKKVTNKISIKDKSSKVKSSSNADQNQKYLVRIVGLGKIATGLLIYTSIFVPTWIAPLSQIIFGAGLIGVLNSFIPFVLSKAAKFASHKMKNSFLKTILENFSQDTRNISLGVLKIGVGICGAPLGIAFYGAVNLFIGGDLKDEALARKFGSGWRNSIRSGIEHFKKIGSRNIIPKNKKGKSVDEDDDFF